MAFLLAVHLIAVSFTMCGCEDAKSIRAVEGETVNLPCHSLPADSIRGSVKWAKNSETICDWTFNYKNVPPTGECIPHFTFNNTSFTLTIENVQFSDTGKYSCETIRLIIPPTLKNISNVMLHVEGLSLHLQNSSNGTCVHLICSLKSLNPELVNFTWTREGQRSLPPSTSSEMNSELHLCKPDWSDGDTIICHASYSNSQIQRSIHLTSENDSQDAPDNESRQGSPAVCVVFFIIFVVIITTIWILFCIFKYWKM